MLLLTHLVLLDPRGACRTLPGVGQDPIGGFRFVSTFALPFPQLRTGAGLMRIFPALEAVARPAGAADRVDARADGHLVAACAGAVAHGLAGAHVVAQQVLVVAAEVL